MPGLCLRISRCAYGPSKWKYVTLNILLVEDQESVGKISLLLLRKRFGERVRWVQSGEEAIEAARQEVPQLVLVDVSLPDMCGYDVARRLRADGCFAETKIVALSGFDRTEQRPLALEAGCDDYLCKPLDIRDLDRLDGGDKTGPTANA